jgi:hypothetical protein
MIDPYLELLLFATADCTYGELADDLKSLFQGPQLLFTEGAL